HRRPRQGHALSAPERRLDRSDGLNDPSRHHGDSGEERQRNARRHVSRHDVSEARVAQKGTKKGPGPRRAGSKRRPLYGGRRRDETELAHLVELIEVDASLSNLYVLDLEDLDSVALHLLVGRGDGAVWALEGSGVRALHGDFLDDPGAAGELGPHGHLAVRERLQPGHGVRGGVLGVGSLESARRVELDVVGVQLLQRLLVVGVERGYETGGRVFGFGHCVSSSGVPRGGGPRRLLPSEAGNREDRYQPPTQSRTGPTIAENGCGCVLIFRGSTAHDCYPSPRLPPSSTHRRPTYGGCC